MTKVLAVMALMPFPAWAVGFKCPVAGAPKGSSKLNLSSAEMPGLQPRISEPLRTAIEEMKMEGTKSGEIVDKLVVAYCSRIEPETSLSDKGKAELVRRFASNLASVVYRGQASDQEDILVNVPVPSSLYGQLQKAAQNANVSQDMWIGEAIKQQLAKP